MLRHRVHFQGWWRLSKHVLLLPLLLEAGLCKLFCAGSFGGWSLPNIHPACFEATGLPWCPSSEFLVVIEAVSCSIDLANVSIQPFYGDFKFLLKKETRKIKGMSPIFNMHAYLFISYFIYVFNVLIFAFKLLNWTGFLKLLSELSPSPKSVCETSEQRDNYDFCVSHAF